MTEPKIGGQQNIDWSQTKLGGKKSDLPSVVALPTEDLELEKTKDKAKDQPVTIPDKNAFSQKGSMTLDKVKSGGSVDAYLANLAAAKTSTPPKADGTPGTDATPKAEDTDEDAAPLDQVGNVQHFNQGNILATVLHFFGSTSAFQAGPGIGEQGMGGLDRAAAMAGVANDKDTFAAAAKFAISTARKLTAGKGIGVIGNYDVTYEKHVKPIAKTPPKPPVTLTVSSIPRITMPKVGSDLHVKAQGTDQYAPDHMEKHGPVQSKLADAIHTINVELAKARAAGKTVTVSNPVMESSGITTLDESGNVVMADKEIGQYASQEMKDALETCRRSGLDVSLKPDEHGNITVNYVFTSSVDNVASLLGTPPSVNPRTNMSETGAKLVNQYAGHPATVGGQPTTITANDVLSAGRMYTDMKAAKTEGVRDWLATNPDQMPPTLKNLTPEAAAQKIVANPEAYRSHFQSKGVNYDSIGGLKMPTELPMGRKVDGKWVPMQGKDGKPVTIPVSTMEKIQSEQLRKTPPKNAPTGHQEVTETTGQVDMAEAANSVSTPNDITTTGSDGSTHTVDMGAPLPEDGQPDPAVQQLTQDTTTPSNAQSVGESAGNVDTGLQEVENLFVSGAVKLPEGPKGGEILKAWQDYMAVKDANAAKKLVSLLQNMRTGGDVNRFVDGVIHKINASVRLNAAIKLLPPDLKKVAETAQTKITSTVQPVKTPAGRVDDHHAPIKESDKRPEMDTTLPQNTPDGAKKIVSTLVKTYVYDSKLGRTSGTDNSAKTNLTSALRNYPTALSQVAKDLGPKLAHAKSPEEATKVVQAYLGASDDSGLSVTRSDDGFNVQLAGTQLFAIAAPQVVQQSPAR